MENEHEGPLVSRWEELTKTHFDAIDRSEAVVLVTCSPMEVHGPHLPLGADVLQGAGLARRALRFLPESHRGRDFLELPPVYAAADPVPQPGSIAFRTSTVVSVLEDLGHSLATQGFRNIVVSNFHGSPRHFLSIETACERVARRHGVRMVSLFSVMLGRLNGGGAELGAVLGHLPGVEEADFEGDTHGGLVETSQLLALHPDLVDPDYKGLPRSTVEAWLAREGAGRAADAPRGKPAGMRAMVRDYRATFRYFAEETYTGKPGKATPELGEQILDTLSEKAAQALVEILDGELPPAQWHSPFWKLRKAFVPRLAVRFFDRLLDTPRAVG